MAVEDLENVDSTRPEAPAKSTNDEIDDDTYQKMIDILDDLIDHTHIFYDDYSTACNCNCNCACTRGTC